MSHRQHSVVARVAHTHMYTHDVHIFSDIPALEVEPRALVPAAVAEPGSAVLGDVELPLVVDLAQRGLGAEGTLCLKGGGEWVSLHTGSEVKGRTAVLNRDAACMFVHTRINIKTKMHAHARLLLHIHNYMSKYEMHTHTNTRTPEQDVRGVLPEDHVLAVEELQHVAHLQPVVLGHERLGPIWFLVYWVGVVGVGVFVCIISLGGGLRVCVYINIYTIMHAPAAIAPAVHRRAHGPRHHRLLQ